MASLECVLFLCKVHRTFLVHLLVIILAQQKTERTREFSFKEKVYHLETL